MSDFWKINERMKVALVKQANFPDLYICPPLTRDYYKYSPFRSGPLGLMEAFDVDYYIVNEYDSDECRTWRQKINVLKHRSAESWFNTPNSYALDGISQGDYAIEVEEIDFSCYDIVISFDIAVPSCMVARHPSILWCYFITEPPMQAYKDSIVAPLFGYDVFLNQRFRNPNDAQRQADDNNASHVIDFPYVLAGSSTYFKLFDLPPKVVSDGKTRVVIPRYAFSQLSEKTKAILLDEVEIVQPSGNVGRYLKTLASCDYYLRPGNTPKFGNESIEAVASGLIFVASVWGWKNRVFNVKGTTIKPTVDIDSQAIEGLELIRIIHGNSVLREDCRRTQKQILDSICFDQPLSDLIQRCRKKKMNI